MRRYCVTCRVQIFFDHISQRWLDVNGRDSLVAAQCEGGNLHEPEAVDAEG
jgi:hypothetical protein